MSVRTVVAAVAVIVALGGCSGGDGDPDAAADDSTPTTRPVRFCDAFLDYLGEPTPVNLDRVVTASDDGAVAELAGIIAADDRTARVLAASSDLEALARDDCQAEWVGGAQGAGNTGAAAQAMLDALIAGDRFGARNIASANAIAVFEPWEPLAPDPELGTPTLVSVDEGTFVLALDADTLAECQVETGVVLACTVAR